MFKIAIDSVKYELNRKGERKELGSGSFGRVYSATYAGEPVAVKVIRLLNPHSKESDVQSFWREVELHYGLRHDNIVAVHGAYVDDDDTEEPPEYAVVMHRMAEDFDKLLHQSGAAVPLERRLLLLYQVARALRFLHSRDVVHGDLKPANTLIDEHGNARLSDFGLSRLRRELGSDTRSSMRGPQGTAMYMDPALLTPTGSLSKASDVYAWALIAWEAAVLERPYHEKVADNPNAVGVLHLLLAQGHRPDVRRLPSLLLDLGLGQLLTECWAQEPAARPTMAAALERFEAIRAQVVAAGAGAATPNASSDPQPQTPLSLAVVPGSSPISPVSSPAQQLPQVQLLSPTVDYEKQSPYTPSPSTTGNPQLLMSSAALPPGPISLTSPLQDDHQAARAQAPGAVPSGPSRTPQHTGGPLGPFGPLSTMPSSSGDPPPQAQGIGPQDAGLLEPTALISNIEAHKRDGTWLEQAAAAIRAVPFPNTSTAAVTILPPHMCEPLVRWVLTLRDEELAVAAMCWGLRNLARPEPNRVELARGGCILGVVELISQHFAHPKVLAPCFGVVGNLSINERNKAEIAKSGLVLTIVQALQRHDSDPVLVEQACTALQVLSTAASAQTIIAADNNLRAIVVVGLLRPSASPSPGTALQACRIVRNLACAGPAAQAAIFKAGGMQPLIQLIKGDRQVVAVACSALTALAHPPGSTNDDAKLFIGKQGGVEAALHALAQADNHVAVAAMSLLNTLLSAFRNRLLLVEAGGVTFVVAALKEHKQDSNVLQLSAQLLTLLCDPVLPVEQTSKTKHAILEAGGAAVLMGALNTHTIARDVLPALLHCVQALIYNQHENIIHVINAGVFPLLQRLMETHIDSARVVQEACGLLMIMHDDVGKEQLGKLMARVVPSLHAAQQRLPGTEACRMASWLQEEYDPGVMTRVGGALAGGLAFVAVAGALAAGGAAAYNNGSSGYRFQKR